MFSVKTLHTRLPKSEQKIFVYLLNEIVFTVDRRYYVPTPVGRGERKILFIFQGIIPAIEVYV